MLRLLVSAMSLLSVSSYSSGTTDCQLPNHGTFKTSIPTDWALSLLDSTGTAVTQWSAGQTYTAQIKATSTSFKGWTWGALKGAPTSFPAGSANKAGTFAAGDSYSHVISGCPGVLTQTNANTRTLIKATWTPPAPGTGTVSLWAMMIISKNGHNYNAVLSVPELVSGGSVTASPSVFAATHSPSKGASQSATETASASSGLTPSAKSTHVAAAVPVPVTVAVAGASYNPVSAVAIGVGGGVAGLVVIGVTIIGVIMVIRQPVRKPITSTVFNLPPLSVATVNPLESSRAYSVHAI